MSPAARSPSTQATSAACAPRSTSPTTRVALDARRELARLGLTGYSSTVLGVPVIEEGGACDEPNSGEGKRPRISDVNPG